MMDDTMLKTAEELVQRFPFPITWETNSDHNEMVRFVYGYLSRVATTAANERTNTLLSRVADYDPMLAKHIREEYEYAIRHQQKEGIQE